jgi:hypothetical protein
VASGHCPPLRQVVKLVNPSSFIGDPTLATKRAVIVDANQQALELVLRIIVMDMASGYVSKPREGASKPWEEASKPWVGLNFRVDLWPIQHQL